MAEYSQETFDRMTGTIKTLTRENEHYEQLTVELREKVERYEKALREISESKADSSCNELALEYEVIADKALNQ